MTYASSQRNHARRIYITHRKSNSNPWMESLSMIWIWIISFLSSCPLPTSNLFVDGPTQTLFTCTCGPQRTYSRIFQPCCIPHMRKWEQVRRFRHLIAYISEPSPFKKRMFKVIQKKRQWRQPWSDIRIATSYSPATIVTCMGGREGSWKCLAWVASIDC